MRRLTLFGLIVLTLGVFARPQPPARAAFPGANGKIAFVSDRDGSMEVFVMNADGSGQTNLTSSPAIDWWPSWSPDGRKIAFESDRDGNFEVYVMDADGNGQTRLTNNSAFDGKPAWSPDGSQIAFASGRDGNIEVYVMNADGSHQTRLTDNPASDSDPVWSPDGSQIAFVSRRDNPDPSSCAPCNSEIYVMNADGTEVTRLTDTAAFNSSSGLVARWITDCLHQHQGRPQPPVLRALQLGSVRDESRRQRCEPIDH